MTPAGIGSGQADDPAAWLLPVIKAARSGWWGGEGNVPDRGGGVGKEMCQIGVMGWGRKYVRPAGFTALMAEDGREHPRELIRAACAEYGEDAVIDWCVELLSGAVSPEDAFAPPLV